MASGAVFSLSIITKGPFDTIVGSENSFYFFPSNWCMKHYLNPNWMGTQKRRIIISLTNTAKKENILFFRSLRHTNVYVRGKLFIRKTAMLAGSSARMPKQNRIEIWQLTFSEGLGRMYYTDTAQAALNRNKGFFRVYSQEAPFKYVPDKFAEIQFVNFKVISHLALCSIRFFRH